MSMNPYLAPTRVLLAWVGPSLALSPNLLSAQIMENGAWVHQEILPLLANLLGITP